MKPLKNRIVVLNEVFQESSFIFIEEEDGIQMMQSNMTLNKDDLIEFLDESDLNIEDFEVVATRESSSTKLLEIQQFRD